MPPFLVRLVEASSPRCPDDVESFNPCIVTHYQRGAGIGWHTDSPRFGEVIMGIRLGAPGRMPFRADAAAARAARSSFKPVHSTS